MSESEDVLKAKICLIGDSCVGKTSLIRRYVHNEFDDRYVSTLGAKICKKEMTVDSEGGDVKVNTTIWDIMGEKGFRELLMDSYFDGAGGILAVCDLTREETFEGLKDWITAVRLITGDVPIAFVGNKEDLEDLACTEVDLSTLAGSYDSSHFLASAKTGNNVNRAFLDLAKRMLGHKPKN
ncbi:MAG: GTP-binding protein [Methanomassiliicoccales archaeon]|nr:MAG: GTP-binding protein [Methanomassiliicoccales archaeon]